MPSGEVCGRGRYKAADAHAAFSGLRAGTGGRSRRGSPITRATAQAGSSSKAYQITSGHLLECGIFFEFDWLTACVGSGSVPMLRGIMAAAPGGDPFANR